MPPKKTVAIAMAQGASALCPGCMLDRKMPDNLHGAALHSMPGGSRYECHASEAWQGVPEWEAARKEPNDAEA